METRPETFSEIMVLCGLNPNFDSGLFYYHLSELIEKEVVEKDGEVCRSTGFGRSLLKVLRTIESEYSSFRKEKKS